jgi:predicted PhzF superfamily epimerase YddE/YHI9
VDQVLGFTPLGDRRNELVFETRSGPLSARREGERYWLDMPAPSASPEPANDQVVSSVREAFGCAGGEVLSCSGDLLLVLDDQAAVRDLAPEPTAIEKLDGELLIATAPGSGEFDVCSRVFAPKVGIFEDPVTGAAHCVLTPYWSDRLGPSELVCEQASSRGGTLICRWHPDRQRVELGGLCRTFSRGEFSI